MIDVSGSLLDVGANFGLNMKHILFGDVMSSLKESMKL